MSLDPEFLAQTLIQLETFSFTPNGVLVWCKDFGVHAQLLQAVPFSEHTDDKTAREYASASLFFGYVSGLEALAQQPGFLRLQKKSISLPSCTCVTLRVCGHPSLSHW